VVRARRQQDAGPRQAFREAQRRAIAALSERPAKQEARRRRRRVAPLLPWAAAQWRTITLDTAVFVGPALDDTITLDAWNVRRICTPAPPAASANRAQLYLDYRSHVPGTIHFELPPDGSFGVDFAFRWVADADVTLNAVSFVLPNGTYWAETDWYGILLNARAWVSLVAGMDVAVFDASGENLLQLSQSAQVDALERGAFTGVFGSTDIDAGPYDDVSEVLDNGGLSVRAGSQVFAIPWVWINCTSGGWAFANLDFLSFDGFGIEVPAVYLGVESGQPIG
jgi:hypothetical protein